jgi:hypothetical protein
MDCPRMSFKRSLHFTGLHYNPFAVLLPTYVPHGPTSEKLLFESKCLS